MVHVLEISSWYAITHLPPSPVARLQRREEERRKGKRVLFSLLLHFLSFLLYEARRTNCCNVVDKNAHNPEAAEKFKEIGHA